MVGNHIRAVNIRTVYIARNAKGIFTSSDTMAARDQSHSRAPLIARDLGEPFATGRSGRSSQREHSETPGCPKTRCLSASLGFAQSGANSLK
jgi:hypothetical protein